MNTQKLFDSMDIDEKMKMKKLCDDLNILDTKFGEARDLFYGNNFSSRTSNAVFAAASHLNYHNNDEFSLREVLIEFRKGRNVGKVTAKEIEDFFNINLGWI